jgi:Cu(I)/Ag(I) efflux system membrane fusion protein
VLFEEARLDLKRLGFGDPQIEEIRTARDVQLDVTLPSPGAGVLISRNAFAQQGFVKGAELFRVADLRRVWILADMSGDGVSHMTAGETVNVTLPDRPDTTFRAKVGEALPLFNGDTRTLKVRLEVDNPQLALRPDMFVNLEFPAKMPESITVAADAIRETGLRKTVFVSRGNGSFEPRDVETGWRFGDRVQITKGLNAGDIIVESGNYLLDSESRLHRTDSHTHD